ncbi:M48 family metallopeptidase [Amylibacter sp. SFDW26]|uniref:M48 family metallopeptidase n=1 Tax=Amylibacter sp. SFDW26 TaxID=2652722 RepID=UPI001261DF6A|nr:SprT family zinc-dependent metalloprotease [Amylibacter sp. SFDW26]KAB7615219.1 M48 family metallopeptidase [Amylibacter sp. SFDW26]
MVEQIEIGDPAIAVAIKRSARARRYSLRISNKDGSISLTVPKYAVMSEALNFAREHEGWMRKHLAKQLKPLSLQIGGSVLFDGEYRRIEPGTGRIVRFDGEVLQVPGSAEMVPTKLKAYFKAMARERMVSASIHYADLLGKPIGRITMRDTRSRWGSCTSDGNLMYSWRLIMAPKAVQAYVAAHEACHLIEMNHSDAYWALVANVFPDYKTHRSWLKKNGSLLHRYMF